MAKISESKQAQKDLDKAPKEMLRGEWHGYRSSRLSLKWRVIYQVSHSSEIEIVSVSRVTAHDYRRK